MNDSDVQNNDFRDDERVQIVDLDREKGPQIKYVEKISAILHKSVAISWARYSLFGSLLLILLSVVFLPSYWPRLTAHTTNAALNDSRSNGAIFIVSSPSISISTPPSPPALLALQQRPLRLPKVSPGSPCPTSPERKANSAFGIVQGNGPAYAAIDTESVMSPAVLYYADAQHFANRADNQGWGGQSVFWFINLGYQGFVLVRGHQLDGPHAMEFNQSFYDPLAPQLVLDTTLHGSFSSSISSSNSLPTFTSYTRLQAPGCYAYQVDGSNFSDTIVFQAVVKNQG